MMMQDIDAFFTFSTFASHYRDELIEMFDDMKFKQTAEMASGSKYIGLNNIWDLT